MFEEETEEKTNLSSAEIALQLAIDLSNNDQDGLLYYSYTLLSRGHILQTQSVSELARENPFLIALNLADVVLNNSRFISLPESIQLKIQQAFTLYLELAITQFQSSPKIIYDTLRTTSQEARSARRGALDRRASTGEAGDASHRKVIGEAGVAAQQQPAETGRIEAQTPVASGECVSGAGTAETLHEPSDTLEGR